MVIKRIFNLSNLTLLTALTLSAIAAWYSILGLTAIFAAAVLPIIIMGSSLEVAKVVTTVWLHTYWDKISWQLKVYLVPAVVALAFLTSMGIFGFLSKAHMDQGVPTGDIAAKVALIDEKIKTQRENIDISRKALAQMDAQVDQRLSRSDTENGVDKAVVIRKQQAKERASLQGDIAAAQKEIASLNEQRAPIASELRKVEAEVGPIKYIAALIYGDNPDQNVLERAVRWVIILIVFVFDPLALTLVIASDTSRQWESYNQHVKKKEEDVVEELVQEPVKETEHEPYPEIEEHHSTADEKHHLLNSEKFDFAAHPYLFTPAGDPTPPGIDSVGHMVYKPEEPVEPIEDIPVDEPVISDEITVDTTVDTTKIPDPVVETEGLTREKPYKDLGNGYVQYAGKMIKKEALMGLKPEFFMLEADSAHVSDSGFGTEFPKVASRGDTFVRVDMLPNRVYKFDGHRWIEVKKELSDSYLHNKAYIQHLISKIDNGEYDVDLLSDIEREQIEDYLRSQNS